MLTLADVWPAHGIQLCVGDLELRAMTEADVAPLAEILPDDGQLDPALSRYEGFGAGANRRSALAQGYWRSVGNWSTQSWALPFVVSCRGELLGMQWLEGPAWTQDRTVDSASWLTTDSRGRGVGTEMRRAILAFAFGSLGARAAVTSAVIDNHASLAVSRAVGYVDTHQTVLEHSGATLVHLRLEREVWAASERPDVVISGFAPAAPLFGLTGDGMEGVEGQVDD